MLRRADSAATSSGVVLLAEAMERSASYSASEMVTVMDFDMPSPFAVSCLFIWWGRQGSNLRPSA